MPENAAQLDPLEGVAVEVELDDDLLHPVQEEPGRSKRAMNHLRILEMRELRAAEVRRAEHLVSVGLEVVKDEINPTVDSHVKLLAAAGNAISSAALLAPNFRRLVLGCMDSYDSEQRRIFQHFHYLQDLHPFAPLQSQILQILRNFFRDNFRMFSDFQKFC